MTRVLAAAAELATGSTETRTSSLLALMAGIADGENLDARDERGLRAVDILCRGVDSDEAAKAICAMAEVEGFGEQMLAGPDATEMPPMMAACFRGSPDIVKGFLTLGMPADFRVDVPMLKLLKGTAFHATVLGYRKANQHDFEQVMSLLLTYCPEGVDVPDRMRRRPVDLAVLAAAETGDRTLADALVSFGATTKSQPGVDAESVMKAMAASGRHDTLSVVMARGAAYAALREVDQVVALEALPQVRSPRP